MKDRAVSNATSSAASPGPTSISRRSILMAGVASAGLVYLSGEGLLAPAASATGDYTSMRLAWRSMLIGSYDPNDEVVAPYVQGYSADAQGIWASMNKSSERTYLWYDLSNTNFSANLTATADRLRQLAMAYSAPGSSLEGNATLFADISSALDWFLANRYNADRASSYNNWWDWQIGVPLRLNDLTVLLYDNLSTAQINTVTATILRWAPNTLLKPYHSTGANLVWHCSVHAVRDILAQTSEGLDMIPAALAPLYQNVTSGDGFYKDGSFVQHKYFAYTGGYGASLFIYLAPLLRVLKNTTWQATQAQLDKVFTWVQTALRPFLYNGLMMDSVRGREISRFNSTDHQSGHGAIAAVLQLVDTMASADGAILKQQVKHWISADTAVPFFTFDPAPTEQLRIGSISQARALMLDSTVTPSAESVESLVFTNMARALHRRPAFALAVAMNTAGIRSYESINSENHKGWYTGFGATYLHLASQPTHFSDAFWPTIDPYRIPGTTVDTIPRTTAASIVTTNTWAGGATVDGLTAAGMGLQLNGITLTGKKSWFMIGDATVCLGAGISSSDSRTIETVVENRNVGQSGTNALIIDGTEAQAQPNGQSTETTASWANISDVGGYVFPGGAQIKALRADRTGAWTSVNTRAGTDKTVYSRRYVTLWIDHGANPQNASYAYVLLPGASAAQTSTFAGSNDVSILVNSPQAQALTQTSTGATLINFWQVPASPVAGISVDHPCSVVTQMLNGTLTVAVADPTRTLTQPINVTISQTVTGTTYVDPAITVLTTNPSLTLSVAVSGAAGASRIARFSM